MKKNKVEHYSDKEALEFHNSNKSGKIEIISSKPMTSKRDPVSYTHLRAHET